MKTKILLTLIMAILVIPAFANATTSILVDADPSTPGIQESVVVLTGETFFTDIYLDLSDDADSVSSLSYSLMFGNILDPTFPTDTVPLPGFADLECRSRDATNIYNCAQFSSLGAVTGPSSDRILTVQWTALEVGVTTIMPYINPGDIPNNILPDLVSDSQGNEINPILKEAEVTVTVVPEPISSALFIVGGATLGFRQFRKKRRQ